MTGSVVLLAPLLSRASGGLAASVPSLAWHLHELSVNVTVLGVEDWRHIPDADVWGPEVRAHRAWFPRSFLFAPGIDKSLHELRADIVDVQGIWTYPSLANWRNFLRTNAPYIVTPRGMLDPWALKRSSFKKSLVRIAFEGNHLKNAACIRATSEMEAENIRHFGLRNPIAVVPNGVDIPLHSGQLKIEKKNQILFLSRMHPKKGVELLLHSWQRLQNEFLDWELVIAGPDEVGYSKQMKELAQKLNLARIVWVGGVYGEQKEILYRQARLFVLPTHSENFGLVIAEALSYGLPVITTKNAPWQGLKNHSCGWWVELDVSEIEGSMRSALSMDRNALVEMGMRGRAWVQNEYGLSSVAERMSAVYNWLSLGEDCPSFVYL